LYLNRAQKQLNFQEKKKKHDGNTILTGNAVVLTASDMVEKAAKAKSNKEKAEREKVAKKADKTMKDGEEGLEQQGGCLIGEEMSSM
jgi:hypothetical protein